MRHKQLFLAFAIALSVATGCHKPDNPSGSGSSNVTPSTPGGNTNTPYFTANIRDMYPQGADDTGFTISVQTNITDWTVECSADWLVITKKSTEVVCVPKPIERDGTYAAPRSCTVTIKAGTVFNKTFSVVQEGWTRLQSVYELKLKPGGESVEVSVTHNCYSWTPSTTASWLTVKKKDTGTLVITSSARSASDTTPRKGVVKLQSDWQDSVYWNITVSDADSNLGNEDYKYGDQTDWD